MSWLNAYHKNRNVEWLNPCAIRVAELLGLHEHTDLLCIRIPRDI